MVVVFVNLSFFVTMRNVNWQIIPMRLSNGLACNRNIKKNMYKISDNTYQKGNIVSFIKKSLKVKDSEHIT